MTTDNLANNDTVTTSAQVPRAILFWAGLLMLLAGGMAFYAARTYLGGPKPSGSQAVMETPVIPPGEWVTSFALDERNGKQLGSEDLKGKVWIANFFYATCPGSCRQQTMLVAGLERDYRDKDVRFVSITCDPKQDTPAALRDYAHDFDAPKDWWFLTGDLLYIRRVGAEFFRLAVSEKGHQDRLAVVDKWGNVRGRFNWHDELQMEKLKKMVDELIVEETPPAVEGAEETEETGETKGTEETEETGTKEGAEVELQEAVEGTPAP